MTTHEIGTVDDFPRGQGKKVDVNGIEIAVFNIDGDLYGIQNVCPHKRLPLHVIGRERYRSEELVEAGDYCVSDDEKLVDEDIRGGINEEAPSINCPWHFLEFDLETGRNEAMDVHVATYDVHVDSDGTVEVEI